MFARARECLVCFERSHVVLFMVSLGLPTARSMDQTLRLPFEYYWGESERAPHLSYCCAKSSLYIRMLGRPASNLVPRWAPLNAKRANVGPASNDSKVDNIAKKTATLVSRFSNGAAGLAINS